VIQLIKRLIREIVNGKAVINSHTIYGYGLWVTITIYGYNKELSSYTPKEVYGYKLYLIRAIGQYIGNLGLQLKVCCRLVRAPILATMLIHQLHGSTRVNSAYFMSTALMPNYYNCYFSHYNAILQLYMPIKRNGITLQGKITYWSSQHVHRGYNGHSLNLPGYLKVSTPKTTPGTALTPILIQSYTLTKFGTIGLRTTFK